MESLLFVPKTLTTMTLPTGILLRSRQILFWHCVQYSSMPWQVGLVNQKLGTRSFTNEHVSSDLLRGTQRVFSVKFLFEKQIQPSIFFCLRTAKNLQMNYPSMYKFSKLILQIPYDFLNFNSSCFTTQVTLFFVEKGNLRFSDSKM